MYVFSWACHLPESADCSFRSFDVRTNGDELRSNESGASDEASLTGVTLIKFTLSPLTSFPPTGRLRRKPQQQKPLGILAGKFATVGAEFSI